MGQKGLSWKSRPMGRYGLNINSVICVDDMDILCYNVFLEIFPYGKYLEYWQCFRKWHFMMVYEVNLKVDAAIAGEYGKWLKKHIDEMLTFDGFLSCDWYSIEDENIEDKVLWTIHYHVGSFENLENYFDNHAEKMRSEAMSLFKNRFSATRRILRNIEKDN